jgi:outer membrane protein OmpA-like peptidoglycan-associated protein
MRRALLALTVAAVAVTGTTACATKGYVNTQVGDVDGKVTTLSGEVERNQQRISEVDEKAGAAGEAARQADARAAQAGDAARDARVAADAAGDRVEELDRANRRLVYEVVLNEAQGGFKFGTAELPPAAKEAVDQVITQLQEDPKAVWFEIEGHTDSVGNPTFNERLGLQRAEAVKRYLYETHQIPLHKMNVISFGETKPVGDNKTRDGRAENRRVVIRMLS